MIKLQVLSDISLSLLKNQRSLGLVVYSVLIMVSFECDYNNGMAPKILERLIKENDIPQSGYGKDEYTLSAAKKIKDAIGRDDVIVSLIGGGTETNQLVISALLNRAEGVIAPSTGHINVHESGAIEYTGHKVIALPQTGGKLTADSISSYMEEYASSEPKDALVTPRMVYISLPTEIGTIYSKKELEDIRKACDEYSLLLFIDGARLAYALASPISDVTLPIVASVADAFYIGGTKCGAIIGEAVVIKKNISPKNFNQMKKQSGAMLAKGRLLGIQFDTLFSDGYYLENGRVGIERADELKALMKKKGYKEAWKSPTNQLFFLMDEATIERLSKDVVFEKWEKREDEWVVRFCTSWSTKKEDIEVLEALL